MEKSLFQRALETGAADSSPGRGRSRAQGFPRWRPGRVMPYPGMQRRPQHMPEFVDRSPPGECIFCRIVRGELPAAKVHEDALTLAFMDIGQVTPGHVLVASKRHAATLLDLTPQEAGAVMQTAQRMAQAQQAAFAPDGITLLQANGAAGGQTVALPLACGGAPYGRWRQFCLAAPGAGRRGDCRLCAAAARGAGLNRRRLSRRRWQRQSRCARSSRPAAVPRPSCAPRPRNPLRGCCARAGRPAAGPCRWPRTAVRSSR